jgi:hypothetical protein
MLNRFVRADSLGRIQTEKLHEQIEECLVVDPDLIREIEAFLKS